MAPLPSGEGLGGVRVNASSVSIPHSRFHRPIDCGSLIANDEVGLGDALSIVGNHHIRSILVKHVNRLASEHIAILNENISFRTFADDRTSGQNEWGNLFFSIGTAVREKLLDGDPQTNPLSRPEPPQIESLSIASVRLSLVIDSQVKGERPADRVYLVGEVMYNQRLDGRPVARVLIGEFRANRNAFLGGNGQCLG